MKGSLIVVSFFLAGVLSARQGWVSACLTDESVSRYILYGLMFFVGMSVGGDGQVVRTVREQGIRILLLPFGTMIGTFAGVAAVSLFVSRTLTDCLAVGAGFGYYSLSSLFITQYKGAELGMVALMANILREIVTLLFAPLFAVLFGKYAPISAGGATSMDSTLPVIAKTVGPELVIVSIVHGIVVDFSVPFWVAFFCSF